MDARLRTVIGVVVLVVGWSVVAGGGVLLATATFTHAVGRDERAGLGLAVIMGGLLVVLSGNYIHHRARIAAEAEAAAEAAGQEPGLGPGPGRSVGP
jgi:hypothetical protein